MKTIFITSFHPMISRNILSSGLLDELQKQNDLKMVIIVPDYKVDYFRKNFGSGNIIVEGVPLYSASATWRGLLFKKLGIYLFNTKSALLRKQYELYLSKNYIRYRATRLCGFFGRSFLLRRIIRFLDLKLSPKGFFKPLIDKYRPSLVFSTDLQNENDVSLMQDARDMNVKIASMVRSWDNLSLRITRIYPDLLVVGSNELKDEAIKYHGFKKDEVLVAGNPHYDRYIRGATLSRDQFFNHFGLPKDRRLILYAPVSDALMRVNTIDKYVLELLSTVDASILVRFPPEKKVTLEAFEKPSNMFYDRPGQAFSGKEGDREIRRVDDEMLINSLIYADLVITGPTSITIDAALFDKPAIAVNLYEKKMHFFETVWRYQDNHIQKLLKTEGVYYVENKEQLFEAIKKAFHNPKERMNGRKIIRDKWFSHADGQSAKRLASILARNL